jgi:Glycosyl transferase family 11
MLSLMITGGLGNQLFQLAAAIHLRDGVGMQVVLDRQFFSHQDPDSAHRVFELDQLPHGFTIIRGRGQSSRFQALPRALGRRLITRGARVILFKDAVASARESKNPGPAEETLIELSESGLGFYSAVPPQAHSLAMRSLLETRIPLAFDQETDSPYIGVHSRLGDYLNTRWRTQLGPTDPVSLLELGRNLSEKYNGLPIRVFTDSPKIFKELCPKSITGPYEISEAVSSWDALTGMARSHAFVMSNSTLSWWAAFIATSTRNEPPEVHMPFPWQVEPSAFDDLMGVAGWTRYERRLLGNSADFTY